MVPLIIHTGASVTVTPYITDFVGSITLVQAVKIQGIAKGLQVRGTGTIAYRYHNDDGKLMTLTIPQCLYIPQCTACLLCPRQIASLSSNPMNGFYMQQDTSTLYFQGKSKTMWYDTTSGFPILFTTQGISSFQWYCANKSKEISGTAGTNPNTPYTLPNITPNQQLKLHLEQCAHAHWEQINYWIRSGLLPCDASLASEPNPVCATCQFGKAHPLLTKLHLDILPAMLVHQEMGLAPAVWRQVFCVNRWPLMVPPLQNISDTAPFG